MLVVLLAGLRGTRAQFNTPINPQAVNSGPLGEVDHEHAPGEEPYLTRELQQKQLKRLREEHQRQMMTDTARMVALATAMKEEVDKGDKSLTADVLKEADEIDKLAKRVSDRIKSQ